MLDVRDVESLGCKIFKMSDAWDVGCALCDIFRGVGCSFTKCGKYKLVGRKYFFNHL